MRWLAALLVFGVAVVAADPTETAPIDDKAGVIADADEPALNGEVRGLRDAGVKLAVIIIRTTGGKAIETIAIDARGRWYTGSDGAAVFILAIDDRQSRLEVNDALRPTVPDPRALTILDNLRGYLRAADYAGAIRAVVREIRGAATGQPIDSENPHPPVSDPPVHGPSAGTTGTTNEPKKSRGWLVGLLVGGALLLAGGAVWAVFSRKRAMTLSHDGVRHQRPFVADWLWSALKIVGFVLYGVAMIALASGSTRTSSSRSWGSSSSGSSSRSSSSGSSGGGWSGGGASSRW